MNSSLEERMARVEEQINSIRKEVNEIASNHLVHLQNSIDSIYKRLETLSITLNHRPSWLVVIILTAMSSLLVSLITGILITVFRG